MIHSKWLGVLLTIGLLAQSAPGQVKPEPGGEKKRDPAFKKVVDDPALPKVLLIGDSISIGYTPPVRALLKGKANVHRIPANGGPTSNGIKHIDQWLGKEKWAVIHLNFGLHDLKIMPDGKHQVSAEDYEKNLRTIVDKCQQTGAKVILATTTPVPDGKLNPPRNFGDVADYNAIATKVANEKHVQIDDLNAAVTPQIQDLQKPHDVHYKPAGYKVLAEAVAKTIEAALK
jgi:acyl-CoA thioesterase-1